MNCDIREEKGVMVVALSGEVDLDSSSQVRTTLLDCVDRKRGILVDLSAVSYIDSSGVASLVEAYQSARRASIQFGLVSVSVAAMRVLELARLDRVFSIHANVADALANDD
jgi:anti-sigma B factor antagonist